LASAGLEVVRVSRTQGEGHISYTELLSSGVLDRATALIHCAWSSLPVTAEKNPGALQSEDLPLLGRLFDAAAARPDPASLQFVFISSGGAVYGERETPARETDPLAPVGWYGRGKVAAEETLATRTPDVSPALCILRPSNPYGFRHMPDKPQGIVGAAVAAAQSGEPLQLLGGGTSLKDFLHIADFESAIMACLRLQLTGTYNVCGGTSVRVLDVIEMLEDAMGRPVPRVDVPAAPWDVHCSMLSHQKITDATGWQPRRDLREGLLEALQEYRAQRL
jgi:UDP-glucose 4-epimerase